MQPAQMAAAPGQQMAAAAAPAGQFIMAPPMAQGQAATGYMPQIATYNAQGQLVLQPAGSYAFQVQYSPR